MNVESAEQRALMDADAAWAAAAEAADIDTILTFWADDAINYFPGMPPAVGKPAIETLVRENRGRGEFSLSWHATHAEVAATGDLGYTSGPFEMSSRVAGNEWVTQSGHYLCIWKKDASGNWKCAMETSVIGPAS